MSRREQYEARTEALVLPILDENRFELVDVEFIKEGGTWYLRVYIDKEGGITVNDCELVARRMNDILDREDYISESYVFEVSSPGLGRPLKKEKDFVRNFGKEVEVKTYRAIDGEKEFCGYLKAYTDQNITLEDDDGNELNLSRKEIAIIREAVFF